MTKAVALISGGIDSPVAAYLLGSIPGVQIIPVYFDIQPFSNENAVKRVLACYTRLHEFLEMDGLHIIPHGSNLSEFIGRCSRRFTCILCKRMMLRLAECLARDVGAKVLVTGESLGQVASQTLVNTYLENEAVELPVLRPLYCLNKNEVVAIARKIGTYEHSIIPSGCKAIPLKPATTAKLTAIHSEESKLNMPELISKALSAKRISM